jgi:spectinomycin phosphotransferase
MLEKPGVQDARIVARLQDEYGLRVDDLSFLPLGADEASAVYRAVAKDKTPYFVKLRLGLFDEMSVLVPRYLSDQGIGHLVPPLPTMSGQLWANLYAFKLIVYPLVEGRDAYEVPLSDDNWRSLGRALKRIHTVELPPALASRLPQETYPSRWRQMARTFLASAKDGVHEDSIARELAVFLLAKQQVVVDLIGRAERLAAALRAQSPELVLCHADLHAGNILIDGSGDFYIVDWDDAILAPKERDLMYAGGGLMGAGRTPQEEETLFYEGYGQAQIDAGALAYYRYERIVQDIAVFSEQIFGESGGRADREQALRYLMSNFLPDNTIEIAYRSDKTL